MIEASHDAAGRTTITIRGKFSFASYDEFHRAIGRDSRPQYRVDLSDVDYIDSAALGMLLLLRERVNEDKSRVTIVAGHGQPSEVLRLANFSSLFTFA